MLQKVFLRLTQARRFRSGMTILCAIGAIMLVAVGPSPLLANPGAVTLRVDPATRAVPVNGTFTVDIVTDLGTEMDTNGLGAYEFDLVYAYDPNYLEVDSVTDAGQLDNEDQRTVVSLGPNIDDATGQTTFAAYSHPPDGETSNPPGPSGTVVLSEVTLKAKRAGVTTLNLENALLADTKANAWPDAGAGRVLDVSNAKTWNIIAAFFNLSDYDGDGKTDPATWDPATATFRWSESGSDYSRQSIVLGPSTAIPLVGDYDGDGKADPATWDPATKYFRWSESGSGYSQQSIVLGPSTAIPLVGDYDGDGKADPATWDPATKYFRWSESGSGYSRQAVLLGPSIAIPLAGDYDGDGKADPATWDPATVYFRWSQSGSGYSRQVVPLGPPSSVPLN
jgi:hypothetical protein